MSTYESRVSMALSVLREVAGDDPDLRYRAVRLVDGLALMDFWDTFSGEVDPGQMAHVEVLMPAEGEARSLLLWVDDMGGIHRMGHDGGEVELMDRTTVSDLVRGADVVQVHPLPVRGVAL